MAGTQFVGCWNIVSSGTRDWIRYNVQQRSLPMAFLNLHKDVTLIIVLLLLSKKIINVSHDWVLLTPGLNCFGVAGWSTILAIGMCLQLIATQPVGVRCRVAEAYDGPCYRCCLSKKWQSFKCVALLFSSLLSISPLHLMWERRPSLGLTCSIGSLAPTCAPPQGVYGVPDCTQATGAPHYSTVHHTIVQIQNSTIP